MTESGVWTPYSELILAMMRVARLTETRLRNTKSQETGSNILHSTGLGISLQSTGRETSADWRLGRVSQEAEGGGRRG